MTAALQELLSDGKYWGGLAHVGVHPGEDSHWFKDLATGQLYLSVFMNQGGAPVTAILDGYPDWSIPPVGTEVKIAFSEGDYEGDAMVVSRHTPSPDGVAEHQALIVEDTIKLTADTLIETEAPSIKLGKDAIKAIVLETFVDALAGTTGLFTGVPNGIFAILSAMVTADLTTFTLAAPTTAGLITAFIAPGGPMSLFLLELATYTAQKAKAE